MNLAWLTDSPFDVVAFLVGYVFAVVGGLLVGSIVASLWRILGIAEDVEDALTWFGQLVGHVEVVLYATAWVLGFPAFVGLWLTLKLAGQWGRWDKGHKGRLGSVTAPGRSVFDAFLVGNGLSAAYGVVGGQSILWLRAGEAGQAAAAMVALLAASLVLFAFVAMRASRVVPGPSAAAASQTPSSAPALTSSAPAAAAVPSGAARRPRTGP